MVGIRRPLYNLTAVCCFLAGSLLSLPGDGKNGSSASSSTVSQFTLPHTEARNFQATATNRDNIIKSTSQVNASSISQPDYLTTTKPGYLNTTARIQTQTANNASNGSTDPSLFLTPTSHLLETNTFGSDGDRRYISATSLLTSSTKILATEILQSKETQVFSAGTAAASQPKSSTFITTGPTKNTTPVMDHKAFTEENTVASTSFPRTTIREQVITITTSNTSQSVTFKVASSTLLPHKILSAETEQPAKHDHKTTIFDVGNNQGLPSRPVVSPIGNDPLVIAVVVIFVVTVGILTFLGFLRYRQRSNRLRFRRLQDLPMDDMMEDTPLSLYSY
ncbi:PREDICTED: uncharacterized protein LOC106542789 isoform X1 [Thamnophis sirtalis]|uniref:Uncharacterized protein LOC106542789 isoform X1 n=1 Tax=Thamnophis sirtalis TaxID=35019 RepID=A0A6I9Y6K0_9SAUR|nr:PREDICTED: uncharacterized protein LOC106542789 isoform X1 [Thamnophis sirtalis]